MQNCTSVNHSQVTEVWNIYRTNSTVKACTSILKSALLVGGLKFTNAKTGEYDVYADLASSAMDWLICVGLIPVTSRYHELSGSWIPVIPDVSAIDLYVDVDDVGQRRYSSTFRNQRALSGEVSPEIWVWAQGQLGPAADGTLTTAITSLLHRWDFERFLTNRVMVAEQILSNPPLVTQDKERKMNEAEGMPTGVGPEEVELSEIARIRTIENVRFGQHDAYTQNWSGGVPRGDTQYELFSRQCETFHVYAPAERAVVSGPRPHSSLPQLLHFSEYVSEQVYQLFGVHNPHKSRGDNKNAVRTGAVTTDSMNKNIKFYSTLIEMFLNHCHDACMHKSKSVAKDGSSKRKRKEVEEVEDQEKSELDGLSAIATMHGNNNPDDRFFTDENPSSSAITLMRVPGIDSLEVLEFMDAGFLSHAEACAMVRGKLGLIDLAPPKGAVINRPKIDASPAKKKKKPEKKEPEKKETSDDEDEKKETAKKPSSNKK